MFVAGRRNRNAVVSERFFRLVWNVVSSTAGNPRTGLFAVSGKVNLLRALDRDIRVMHNTVLVCPLPRVFSQRSGCGQNSDDNENSASFHTVSIARVMDSGLVAGQQNAARVTVLADL